MIPNLMRPFVIISVAISWGRFELAPGLIEAIAAFCAFNTIS